MRLIAGRSGIRRITLFDPTGYDSQVAGEVQDFDPRPYMDRKEARRADRVTQFAFVAADEALKQSRYDTAATNGNDFAVIIGTAIGGITTLVAEYDTLREKGPGRVSPFLMPMMLADMSSGQLSIRLGAKAVNYAPGERMRERRGQHRRGGEHHPPRRRRNRGRRRHRGRDYADLHGRVLGGEGADDGERRPGAASRPFDADPRRLHHGEGAGVLVLESEEHALARGATILAELAGYGATSDAFHITQPDEHGEGATRAMRKALAQAGLEPDDIDYVNAHGTSTSMNDKLETAGAEEGLRRLRLRAADQLHEVDDRPPARGGGRGRGRRLRPRASRTGSSRRPPTTRHPDPDCDLDYVPNVARSASLEAVMTNSLGFGGHNASLIFRRYRPEQRDPTRRAARGHAGACATPTRTRTASPASRPSSPRCWPRAALRRAPRPTSSTSRTSRPTTTRSNCPGCTRRSPASGRPSPTNETIALFGDFDVDGVTSVAVLHDRPAAARRYDVSTTSRTASARATG